MMSLLFDNKLSSQGINNILIQLHTINNIPALRVKEKKI